MYVHCTIRLTWLELVRFTELIVRTDEGIDLLPPPADRSRDDAPPTDLSLEADRNLGGRVRGKEGHSELLLYRSASRIDSRAWRREDFEDFGLLVAGFIWSRPVTVSDCEVVLERVLFWSGVGLGLGIALDDMPAISSIISSGSAPPPPDVLKYKKKDQNTVIIDLDSVWRIQLMII